MGVGPQLSPSGAPLGSQGSEVSRPQCSHLVAAAPTAGVPEPGWGEAVEEGCSCPEQVGRTLLGPVLGRTR